MLSHFHRAHILSKLDLYDGYHYLPVDPIYHPKTAFICHYGTFKYPIMTFRFKNLPECFQRTMNLMLGDLIDKYILVYLDNILIFSSNKAECEELACLVFEHLA